jgi:hypothetical protein
LHIADLPVGATFTHKGVEYRKVFNKGIIDSAMIMAARHPDHPDVGTVGGQLGAPAVLSVCTECPASGRNNPHGAPCTTTYGNHQVPCLVNKVPGRTLILTIDTAYEMAIAGCVSW